MGLNGQGSKCLTSQLVQSAIFLPQEAVSGLRYRSSFQHMERNEQEKNDGKNKYLPIKRRSPFAISALIVNG